MKTDSCSYLFFLLSGRPRKWWQSWPSRSPWWCCKCVSSMHWAKVYF